MNDQLKKEAQKALTKELEKMEKKKGTTDGFFPIGDFVNDWIDRATLAERKRCAEIARNFFLPNPNSVEVRWNNMAKSLIETIENGK